MHPKQSGGPNSRYNLLSEERKEQERANARKRYTSNKAKAPDVPNRDWTVDEMRELFIYSRELVHFAILKNRNYSDVAHMSATLTQQYEADAATLYAVLGITEAAAKIRKQQDHDAAKVCTECFTSPHQISCSQAPE